MLETKLTRSLFLMTYSAVYMLMQRIWVLCKHCGSSDTHAFYGAKSIGVGSKCPTCGSSWRENHIVASTIGEASSEILGDIRTIDSTKPVKVMWLDT